MLNRVNPRLFKSEAIERCCLDQCKAACCLHGVWVDSIQARDILNHAELIQPHMPEKDRDPLFWFDGRSDQDNQSLSGEVIHSTVLPAPDHYGGTSCVFLRGWDHKCALQVAADANQLHPWRFKPFYCILHPLDLDPSGHITLESDLDLLLQEKGSCLRPSRKTTPLIDTFQPELEYLLGSRAYEALRHITQDQTKLNKPST
ncbi:MAG: hypothetical protein JW750_00030 [Anaerolineaceae bacterium]|nr:hypothetical protein [Anaerolineaceae bacterium]